MKIILIVSISLVTLTSCSRITDPQLVGTWRAEDESNVQELTLEPNHSFRSLTTDKQILATPSVAIEIGSWQRQGDELTFDATLTFDKTKRQIKRTVGEVAKDHFTMTNFADRKTVTYHRFELPSCSAEQTTETRSVRENDLIGPWQMHYNTHDYKFSFLPNGRLEMSGSIDGEWGQLNGGKWHTEGRQLIWQLDKASYESTDPPIRKLKISAIGKDCVTVTEDGSVEYALRRVK
jgi:hypothetical protein